MTEVVAALIFQRDKFLICQRPSHKARGLMWEFVGGKVEPGESKKDALVRECREELGITVRVGEAYYTVEHQYPDITVHLTLYYANIIDGTIQMLEHNDIRWICPTEIPQYSFCPADKEILIAIQNAYKNYTLHIAKKIQSQKDPAYQNFQSRLIPNIESSSMIGVRVPYLRKLAKSIHNTTDETFFLSMLPHCSYEENILHAVLISKLSETEEIIKALDLFLPYVDNWAVCDTIAPKAFQRHSDCIITAVKRWLSSNHPYTVRYAIGVLMRYHLTDAFEPEYLKWVSAVSAEDYYVKMMIAWYFATALAFQYDQAVVYLQEKILPVWTHNNAIQKAVESYRITDRKKAYLRTLRIQ